MSRCVETNHYTGAQCVRYQGHEPNEGVDEYDDLGFDHITESGDSFSGMTTVCDRKIDSHRSCARDYAHPDECRPNGWMAPAANKLPPKPRNTTRCVETNEYGDQCVLIECHEPDVSHANDAYDLSYVHRTARTDEAFTWEGSSNACLKRNGCMRDRKHEGMCRSSGWLAKKTAKPATPKSLHVPLQRPVPVTVQDKALTTALNFLSGLNLQDQRPAVQKEALAVIREIMDALKPDEPEERKDL